jgi:hypothetical protein
LALSRQERERRYLFSMPGRCSAPEPAIDAARSEKEAQQVRDLLGGNPNNADWRAAFLELARRYCNVGRLSYRPLSPHLQARTWTPEADIVLLNEVVRLKEELGSERAAFEAIANI